jgi:transcriptional regulator with XRE-family HTH domain
MTVGRVSRIVGRNCRGIRTSFPKMSLRQLSERTSGGLSVNQLHLIETGQRGASVDDLVIIATALGVTIERLLSVDVDSPAQMVSTAAVETSDVPTILRWIADHIDAEGNMS